MYVCKFFFFLFFLPGQCDKWWCSVRSLCNSRTMALQTESKIQHYKCQEYAIISPIFKNFIALIQYQSVML